MKRALRIGLLAAVFVTSAACGSPGASTRPKVCTAAAAYEGLPVGPSIRPESFAGTRAIAGTLPDDAGLRLDAALDAAAAKMGVASITAAIATADGRAWTATRSTNTPPPVRFWWASTGKAFTAMVVMQLVVA